MRARMKATVVPIRSPKPPAAPPAAQQQIGRAGTEALCLEIPIRVRGFRMAAGPGGENSRGESFEEETSTMLLFARGGVARLAEPVTRGQDLLLINKRTNKLVHCRVKNFRASPDVKSYVEIEFTHTAPDFWGIAFPREASNPVVTPFEPENASPAPAGSWPDAELEAPAKARAAAVGAAGTAVGAQNSAAAPTVAVTFAPASPTPLAEWDDTGTRAAVMSAPPAAPIPWMEASARPSNAAPRMIQYLNLDSLIIPEPRSNRMRLAWAAAGVLCALAVGYRTYTPAEPDLPKAIQSLAGVTGESGRPGSFPALGDQKNREEASATDHSATSSTAGPANAATVSAETPEVVPVEAPRRHEVLVSKMNLPTPTIVLMQREAPDLPEAPASSTPAAAGQPNWKPADEGIDRLAAYSLKPLPPPEPAAPTENAAVPADALVPARLLTAVQPVYPPLARQARIEGNVSIEVWVDASGRITGTKALSGPQLLREAAIRALGECKFLPALLRGQPAASTTIVTVKFQLR